MSGLTIRSNRRGDKGSPLEGSLSNPHRLGVTVSSEDGEIGREGEVILCPLRSAEDGLKGNAWLFHEYAKKSLAVFQTAKIACATDTEAGCLP